MPRSRSWPSVTHERQCSRLGWSRWLAIERWRSTDRWSSQQPTCRLRASCGWPRTSDRVPWFVGRGATLVRQSHGASTNGAVLTRRSQDLVLRIRAVHVTVGGASCRDDRTQPPSELRSARRRGDRGTRRRSRHGPSNALPRR